MKNYGDLRGCYLPQPTASTDNTLLAISILIILHTQPHSVIVNYYYYQRWHRLGIIKQMQLHITLLSSAITPISFQL